MNRVIGPAPTDSRSLESEVIRLRRRVASLESALEAFRGYVYTENPDTINIVSSSAWVDIELTGTLDPTSAGFEALSGKLGLKNVSGKRRLVRVQSTFDGHSLGPNEEMALRLVQNGTKIPGAECHATGTANGVIAKLHSFAHVWVDPGDEIWMQAANFTNSGDIAFERGKMDIHRLPWI